VQDCVVDAGLALVELGLEVVASPKYGNAANADTLGGSTKAQVVAEAQAGTSANAANAAALEGSSKAQVVAQARSGLLATTGNGSQLTGLTASQISGLTSVPAGTVIPFAGSTAPVGYFECNGAAISRTAYAALFAAIGVAHGYGDNASTFNLPDYRGRFLRGWDHAIARDPDRASRTAMNTGGAVGDTVGSVQVDAFKIHTHELNISTNSGGYPSPPISGQGNTTLRSTASAGGNETRPINANVMYCIKY